MYAYTTTTPLARATVPATGDTPLHAAVLHGDVELAALLVQKGADVLASNKKGQTPWSLARARQDDDMLRLFDEANSAFSTFITHIAGGRLRTRRCSRSVPYHPRPRHLTHSGVVPPRPERRRRQWPHAADGGRPAGQ